MKLNRHCMTYGLALLCAVGCGSEEAQEDKDPCENSSCRVAGAPDTTPVSFASQVAPILQKNCNTGSCHGFTGMTASLPAAGLFLGTSSSVDAAAVIANLTGMSETVDTMQIVKPADPANSVLMHKIDGCQNDRGLSCTLRPADGPETSAACGDPMPPPSYPGLCEGDVEVVRRWIAQGAMNN